MELPPPFQPDAAARPVTRTGRLVAAVWLVAATALSTGCTSLADAVHGVETGAREAFRELHEHRRNREWAEMVWQEVLETDPTASADYADGFRDGFAAHLFRGTTEPPPLPPSRYRSIGHQSQPGYHAGLAWIAGYRRGIEEALARQARRWVVGPTSAWAAAATAPSEGPKLTAPVNPTALQPTTVLHRQADATRRAQPKARTELPLTVERTSHEEPLAGATAVPAMPAVVVPPQAGESRPTASIATAAGTVEWRSDPPDRVNWQSARPSAADDRDRN